MQSGCQAGLPGIVVPSRKWRLFQVGGLAFKLGLAERGGRCERGITAISCRRKLIKLLFFRVIY